MMNFLSSLLPFINLFGIYVDLSKLKFDDAVFDQDEDHNSTTTDNVDEDHYLEKGLSIPQDRLEDLDFSLNFFDDDDWIRLGHAMYSDEASRKIFCSNSNHDDQETSSLSEEIESKVEAESESDVCFEQDDQEHQEHKLKEISSTYTHKSYIGRGRFSFQNKKPRSKILRKENRNHQIPRSRQHDRKRSSMMMKSRERKRRCSHCNAEETPQWRTGPDGRNLLCNACGLRYKVGRLVSNYRPAASPSFDCTKHSNYYKRLMRKKMKIVEVETDDDSSI